MNKICYHEKLFACCMFSQSFVFLFKLVHARYDYTDGRWYCNYSPNLYTFDLLNEQGVSLRLSQRHTLKHSSPFYWDLPVASWEYYLNTKDASTPCMMLAGIYFLRYFSQRYYNYFTKRYSDINAKTDKTEEDMKFKSRSMYIEIGLLILSLRLYSIGHEFHRTARTMKRYYFGVCLKWFAALLFWSLIEIEYYKFYKCKSISAADTVSSTTPDNISNT